MTTTAEITLDEKTITSAVEERGRALEISQAEADKAAEAPPVTESGPAKTGQPAAPSPEPPCTEQDADDLLAVGGAWLMPAEGFLARFNDDERKKLAPHVSRLWNKWAPAVNLRWKDEFLALVALATVFGMRRDAIEAQKKAAEAKPKAPAVVAHKPETGLPSRAPAAPVVPSSSIPVESPL